MHVGKASIMDVQRCATKESFRKNSADVQIHYVVARHWMMTMSVKINPPTILKQKFNLSVQTHTAPPGPNWYLILVFLHRILSFSIELKRKKNVHHRCQQAPASR